MLPANGEIPKCAPSLSWRTAQREAASILCDTRSSATECVHYALPCGEPMVEAHALAAAASTSTLFYVTLNSASVDGLNLLVRLTPSALFSPHASYDNETVVWMKCGTSRLRFGPAQDARGIMHRGRHLLAFYSRPVNSHRRIGTLCSWCPAVQCMRNLSAHPTAPPEIRLREPPKIWPEAKKKMAWEKNWLPFEYRDEILLSYRLQPHIVLRCSFTNGSCVQAHRTSSLAAWRMELVCGNRSAMARGSSPVVHIDDERRGEKRWVGVAHFRCPNGVYEHAFFEQEPAPPFAVVRTSPPWRFTTCHSDYLSFKHSHDDEAIQFVSSAFVSRNGRTMVISYGASDRSSMITTVRTRDVLSMLDGRVLGNGRS